MSAPRFDWLQTADRHTELKDPVISVRQLALLDLRRTRLTRFDHCLVYATKHGGYETFVPPDRPRGTSRYRAVYEVDTGRHPVTVDLKLPSENDALEFQASVEIEWQVADAVAYVRSGCRDVPRLLAGELEKAARPVARRFAVTDSAGAEARLLDEAAGWPPLGATAGLTTSWTLRLRRNDQAIAHQLRLQEIDQTMDEKIHHEWRGEQLDAAIDSRRAALLRLQAESAKLYEVFLEQGAVRAWSWYLAQYPDRAHEIVQNMRADQQELARTQLALVKSLFEAETAENHELAEPRRHALQTLTKVLAQPLAGDPNPPEEG
ncbi:hypothetical protein [Streptomyces antimicrobicus]|uniref:PE-PGRS family protein n=1 Tax=Streptomyces antimicrobicus TaxID=2883108 RepID=A0ABS8B256_9ACTN|nr:hypothetical protein [Streptomyces antimicrobicus]MCB5178652.1 hypothetical protein [Streptomyces antimicrobicus]